MNSMESGERAGKQDRRFDQRQYDFLKRCSENGAEGIRAWNHWRRSRPGVEILLQGADLHEFGLRGADLRDARLDGANLARADLRSAKLYRASFDNAVLDGADLHSAILSEAQFRSPCMGAICAGARRQKFSQLQYDILVRCSAQRDPSEWNKWRDSNPDADVLLEGAPLSDLHLAEIRFDTRDPGEPDHFTGEVCLQDADLRDSHFDDARFHNAHMEGASLWGAYLRHADMYCAHLEGANLEDSYWEEGYFEHTHLQGARCRAVVVDGFTLIMGCAVDRHTDFSEVALDNARIDAATKQLLEYNIRRMNWGHWYITGKPADEFKFDETVSDRQVRKAREARRCVLTSPVRLFWCISDYGISTTRIITTFLLLAFAFALMYWIWPHWLQGIRADHDWRSLIHAIYFSIVTMTTLGFGDIAADPDSWQGQVLLMIQVILGYALLGALVTRFAVLFTAGGPAGRFADSQSVMSDQ